MKKNLFVALVVVLALGLFLSACGTAAEAPAEASSDTTAPESSAPLTDVLTAMDGATSLTDSVTEASAADLAKTMGLADGYAWEGWSMPAETTWDDVLSYYDKQAQAAGWEPDAGLSKDIGDNKVAAFGKADGSTLVIIYLPQADQVQVLALAGMRAQ